MKYTDEEGETRVADTLIVVGSYDPDDWNEYGGPCVDVKSVRSASGKELLVDRERLAIDINQHFANLQGEDYYVAWGAMELDRIILRIIENGEVVEI